MMRAFMVVIGLYLLVALAFPLYAMLSKSIETYSFQLETFELQVDKGEGWGETLNALDLGMAAGIYDPADTGASAGHRMTASKLFPDFSFRAPTNYRLRNVTRGNGGFIAKGAIVTDTEWHEFSSNDVRRVLIRPSEGAGLANYWTYFSTPALS
jgi:iron(III) transport system permease protein